jgi:hypothetical protein
MLYMTGEAHIDIFTSLKIILTLPPGDFNIYNNCSNMDYL